MYHFIVLLGKSEVSFEGKDSNQFADLRVKAMKKPLQRAFKSMKMLVVGL